MIRARFLTDQAGLLAAFAQQCFGQVDPEDLADRQVADLYGASLSRWSFARKREPGRAHLRAFNPTIAEHGWQSTHTIIEIVNDDMPFLVDSVTMEVNRHGLTLHLIIHPLVAVIRDGAGSLKGLAPEPSSAEARRESCRGDVAGSLAASQWASTASGMLPGPRDQTAIAAMELASLSASSTSSLARASKR